MKNYNNSNIQDKKIISEKLNEIKKQEFDGKVLFIRAYSFSLILFLFILIIYIILN